MITKIPKEPDHRITGTGDYSAHYLRAKHILVEDEIANLIGKRKYIELTDKLQEASLALQEAAICVYQMHLNDRARSSEDTVEDDVLRRLKKIRELASQYAKGVAVGLSENDPQIKPK